MKKVLIIEDDAALRGAAAKLLATQYQVLEAADGRTGLAIATEQEPDLILLDLQMPEMHGFEVCRKLHSQPGTNHIPVIMITGQADTESCVKGLDVGAIDYLLKPFKSAELMARIAAQLRRQGSHQKRQETVHIGNLTLEPKSRQVHVSNLEVKLTQAEYELLRYFLSYPNETIPRRKILDDLWPNTIVTERTVDTHVAHLRRKIKGFNHPLETVYKAGYILRLHEKSTS